MLVDIYSLNEKETDAVRLDASTIKQLFEDTDYKLEDIRKLIMEKRVMYDHTVDQKGYKWSGKSLLKNLEINFLPEHVKQNKEKYLDWLD